MTSVTPGTVRTILLGEQESGSEAILMSGEQHHNLYLGYAFCNIIIYCFAGYSFQFMLQVDRREEMISLTENVPYSP